MQFACFRFLWGLIPLMAAALAGESATVSEGGGAEHGRQHKAAAVAGRSVRRRLRLRQAFHQRHDRWVGLVIPHSGGMIFGQDTQRLLPCFHAAGRERF